MRYHFGPFELRPQTRELLRHGELTALGGRAFDLLLALVERRDRVVGSAELYQLVWPGVAVQPNNLQVQIWALRSMLGAEAITTVARRGYRFVMPVQGRPVSNGPHWAEGERWPAPLQPLCGLLTSHRLITILAANEASLRSATAGLGQRLLPLAPAGVWAFDARNLQDEASSLRAHAEREAAGEAATPFETMMRRLNGRDVLILLRGCHHAPAAARLAAVRVLGGAKGARIVATSLLRLGMAGEGVVHVPSVRAVDAAL